MDTTPHDLIVSLRIDSRIQALQHKAVSLQHSLRKMTAHSNLKAASPSVTPGLETPLSDADSYFSGADGDLLDDYVDDDSLVDDDNYDYDDDVTIELAVAVPVRTARIVTITPITTGPRLIEIAPRLRSSSSSSTAGSCSSSAPRSSVSSLPPRSSISSLPRSSSSCYTTPLSSARNSWAAPDGDKARDDVWPCAGEVEKLAYRDGLPPRACRNFSNRMETGVGRRRSVIGMYLERLRS